MIIKNIKGKLYQHTPTGKIEKVVYANDDCVTLYNKSRYSTCSTVDFLKFWKPYEAPNDKVIGDNVNHPPHYTWLKDKCGIEVIDITRHMGFCLGNAIKYILRAGHKQDASLTDNQKEIEGPVFPEQIKGKMTGMIRNGHRISTRNIIYIIYSKVWLFLRPVRPLISRRIHSIRKWL